MTNTTNVSAATYYANFFKGWRADRGSKPTDDMLATVHNLGARPGKQALFIAMCLRPEGCTQAQMIMACGAPQLNKMRGYVTDGLLKRLPAPSTEGNGHTVYKLELTAKGNQRVERTLKAAAKAAEAGNAEPADKATAKPKRTSKPRKAKADTAPKAADAATGEPAATGNDVNADQAAHVSM